MTASFQDAFIMRLRGSDRAVSYLALAWEKNPKLLSLDRVPDDKLYNKKTPFLTESRRRRRLKVCQYAHPFPPETERLPAV